MGQQLGGGGDKGGRVYGRVLLAWLVQVEDQGEARYQGWQEGGLRQGGDGEGEACAEDCEGLPGGRPEEKHLSRWRQNAARSSAEETQVPSGAASRGRSAEAARSRRTSDR